MSERYAFIDVEKANHSVSNLCRMLKVSRSGFYDWQRREPSMREQEDEEIILHMRAVHAAVPSREAELLLRQLGIETLSRSTIERTAQAFGERLEDHRDRLDSALLEVFEMPAEATTVSVSVDRIAVPIEKPRPRSPKRPPKDQARRPVEVVYQMAYVLRSYGQDPGQYPHETVRCAMETRQRATRV